MKPYLLILLTLCTLGCDKTDPDPTTSHPPGYYFYCKVDGEEFHPDFKSELGYKNIEAKLLRGDSLLSIHADINEITTGIHILSNNMVHTDTYKLGGGANSTGTHDQDLGIDWYLTDSTHTGQVTITSLDKSNQIVTGTFYFDAYNSITDDTVHITDGVFNLYYQTY